MKVTKINKDYKMVKYTSPAKGGKCIAVVPTDNKGIAGAIFNEVIGNGKSEKEIVDAAKEAAKA